MKRLKIDIYVEENRHPLANWSWQLDWSTGGDFLI